MEGGAWLAHIARMAEEGATHEYFISFNGEEHVLYGVLAKEAAAGNSEAWPIVKLEKPTALRPVIFAA